MISTALELTYNQKIGIIYAVPIVLVLIAVIIFIVKNRGHLNNDSSETKLKEWLNANNFTVTLSVQNTLIDENSKRWTVYNFNGESKIYSFNDIVKVELDENGNKYVSQNGVLRAVVGSAIFGGVGAIVGATTATKSHTINSLNVIVYTSRISDPVITIPLIISPVSDSSALYLRNRADAIKLMGMLNAIAMQNTSSNSKPDEKAPEASLSAADELAKYKKLLDDGAISEEEYSAVKKRLLNL